MTNEELVKLEALASAASPGPWEADIDDPESTNPALPPSWTGKFYINVPEGEPCSWCMYDGTDPPSVEVANARFVAAARSAVPALIEEVRRLQRRVQAFGKEDIQRLQDKSKCTGTLVHQEYVLCPIHD